MPILLLLLITTSCCLDRAKEKPFEAKNIRILNVTTDKPSYAPGDTVIGSVVVQNIGNGIIQNLTIWVTAKNLNYWWAGEKARTAFPVEYKDLDLKPGNSTSLIASIAIPKEVGGFSTAGEYELKVEVYLEKELCDYKILRRVVK
ncbi:MAG: hypothetical protein QXJ68_07955 [Methanocellales archaeon]